MTSCNPSEDHGGLQRWASGLIRGFEHRVLRVPSGSRGPVCSPVEPLQPEGLAMAFTKVRTQRPVDRAAARIGGAGGPEDGVCLKVVVSAAWYKRERSYRAAGTAGELQRSHHEQRACRRQRGKVRELRNAVLTRTEKTIVQRERRVKAGGRAGVDADRFHAYADDRGLLGEPAGALGVEAGIRSVVEEELLVAGASVPARAEEQPPALGQRPVLGLEGAHVLDGEEVVGVPSGLDGFVYDDRGRHEVAGRHLCYVPAFAAGDPVYGRIEVCADVLADLEPVPGPGGAALVVAANLVSLQDRRICELLRKPKDRRTLVQGLGKVHDFDGAAGQRLDECSDGGRCGLSSHPGSSSFAVSFLRRLLPSGRGTPPRATRPVRGG